MTIPYTTNPYPHQVPAELPCPNLLQKDTLQLLAALKLRLITQEGCRCLMDPLGVPEENLGKSREDLGILF